jgi:hypothetical protein
VATLPRLHPALDGVLHGMVAGPPRLQGLGDDAVEGDIERIEERDRWGGRRIVLRGEGVELDDSLATPKLSPGGAAIAFCEPLNT